MRTSFSYNGETLYRETDERGYGWFYTSYHGEVRYTQMTDAYRALVASGPRPARFELNVTIPAGMSVAEAGRLIRNLIDSNQVQPGVTIDSFLIAAK